MKTKKKRKWREVFKKGGKGNLLNTTKWLKTYEERRSNWGGQKKKKKLREKLGWAIKALRSVGVKVVFRDFHCTSILDG